MKSLLLSGLFFLVTPSLQILESSWAGELGNSVTEIAEVSPNEIPKLPGDFLQMKADIERAGSQGKTFQLKFSPAFAKDFPEEEKIYSGPLFLIESLSEQFSQVSKMVFLRDPEILEQLKKLQSQGVVIVVLPHTRGIDAAIFDNQGLFNRSVLQAFTRGSAKDFVLAVTPQMTRDILIHEMEHLAQRDPGHPFSQFLSSLGSDFSPSQITTLRIVLGELMSYRAQYEFNHKMQSLGTPEILEFQIDPTKKGSKNLEDATIQRVAYSGYISHRNLNIRFTLSLNLNFLFHKVKANEINKKAFCRLVHLVKDNLAKMGDMGSELEDDNLAYLTCEK